MEDYDVVVVGKGNAALCAALAARDQGARVGMLEAAPEGESGGNNVMIDNPLIECRRTAAEMENLNEEFTIQGR